MIWDCKLCSFILSSVQYYLLVKKIALVNDDTWIFFSICTLMPAKCKKNIICDQLDRASLSRCCSLLLQTSQIKGYWKNWAKNPSLSHTKNKRNWLLEWAKKQHSTPFIVYLIINLTGLISSFSTNPLFPITLNWFRMNENG